MEKVVISLNGQDYKLFYITINGKEVCVAEDKLNEYIMDCIDNNNYTSEIINVDEMFGYVVPQELADKENEDEIVIYVIDVIKEDDPNLSEFI